MGDSAHSHLGRKYAHLDVEILDMRDHKLFEGVLPELWGYRPLSDNTRSMIKNVSDGAIYGMLPTPDTSTAAHMPPPQREVSSCAAVTNGSLPPGAFPGTRSVDLGRMS